MFKIKIYQFYSIVCQIKCYLRYGKHSSRHVVAPNKSRWIVVSEYWPSLVSGNHLSSYFPSQIFFAAHSTLHLPSCTEKQTLDPENDRWKNWLRNANVEEKYKNTNRTYIFSGSLVCAVPWIAVEFLWKKSVVENIRIHRGKGTMGNGEGACCCDEWKGSSPQEWPGQQK